MIAHTLVGERLRQKPRRSTPKCWAHWGIRTTWSTAKPPGFNDGKNTDFWIDEAQDRGPDPHRVRSQGLRSKSKPSIRQR